MEVVDEEELDDVEVVLLVVDDEEVEVVLDEELEWDEEVEVVVIGARLQLACAQRMWPAKAP